MTGAEILIKMGEDCVFGKVRHSGYDIVDFVKEKGDGLFDIPFDDMWKEYYSWRTEKFDDFSIESEIESDYQQTGFRGKVVQDESLVGQFEKTCSALEDEIAEMDKDSIFLCSYSDYRVLIDCDNRNVWLLCNGEMVLLEDEVEECDGGFEKAQEDCFQHNMRMLRDIFDGKVFQTERERKLEAVLEKVMRDGGGDVLAEIDDVLKTSKDSLMDTIKSVAKQQQDALSERLCCDRCYGFGGCGC